MPDTPKSLTVARLVTGDNDITHFENDSIDWHPSLARTGNAVTAMLPAEQIGFLRMSAGYDSDWHPAPRKQYVMVLEGIMQVEAGSGERREFAPGSILLVTDTQGRGHLTRVYGDVDVTLVWVPVPTAEDSRER